MIAIPYILERENGHGLSTNRPWFVNKPTLVCQQTNYGLSINPASDHIRFKSTKRLNLKL
jgi:hypothetical protein